MTVARITERFRRRKETEGSSILEAIGRIADLAVQASDEESILAVAIEAAMQITGSPGAAVYLPARDRDFVCVQRGGSPQEAERCSQERLQNVVESQRVQSWAAQEGGREVRILGVPLGGRRRAIGVLCALLPSQSELPLAAAEQLGVLGIAVGMALEQVRLSRSAQQDLARLVALQELHRHLVLSPEPERLLPSLLEKVVGFFEVCGGAVLLRDDAKGALTIAAGCGLEKAEVPECLETIRALSERTYSEGKPVMVGDMRAVGGTESEASQHVLASYLGVPLLVNARPIGVLALCDSKPRVRDREEIRFLQAWAAVMATAIENVRLLQAARAAEAEARQQASYRQSVVNSMLDGLFVTDAEGHPIEVNEALCRMTGYQRDELLGKFAPFLDQEATRKLMEAIEACRAGVSLGPLEMRFTRKGGASFPVEVTFSPLTRPEGEFVGLVCIARDVSALQRARAELLQAEKLAAVGRLVSGVAHELNNPLTAILGTADLLRSEAQDEQLRQDLEVVVTQAERASHIVRNLLSFARPRPSERSYIDLNDLILRTLELVAYQMHTAGVNLVTRLDPELPWTMADPHQLQQVILNLVTNAQQAIRTVRPSGTIIVATEKTPANTIRLSCSDDGPGIPPEVKEHLFEPFFTTKGEGEGTGLGLSICYRIVTEHQGRIWAESEVGRGATFFVELPVVAPNV